MASSKQILVVDDEAYIVHVVRLKLVNAGYDVLSAGDGEEGLELAREHLPDLIITDFQMPYLTGLEMCAKLQEDDETASIPVLMLTARGHALEEDELRSVNIIESLSKPFSPRDLLERVAKVMAA
jgi:two-component system alkaline phosphatase synthesis response regulator PhoP